MRKETTSKMRLDLFDGEGGGAAPAPGVEGQVQTQATPGQKSTGGKSERGTGDDAKARTGKASQGEAAEGEVLRQRRRAFREMVTGDFKDVYTEETQRLINHRFKETQALKEQLERQRPLMELLEHRYATPAGDVDGLTRAIREETEERTKVSRQDGAGELWARRQAQQWMDQCRAMAERYPGFDLGREMARPQFAALLRGGATVEQAYQTLHFGELMDHAARRAAAGAEKRVADHIRSRAGRPAENGIAAHSGFITKDDPSKLERKDFEEIAKRAARGETIRF